MRHPPQQPQLFHEAIREFLNALDVSIDRLAPFAGLNPQQLHRLGKDGKHHTLVPTAIDRLLMAPVLVGKPVAPEMKDAWQKHLKVASLYTILIVAAHRRTNSQWPQTTQDYAVMWETASDLALYSKYTVYYMPGAAYQNQGTRGFSFDAVQLHDRWDKDRLETDQDIFSTLDESDKT